MFCHWRSCTVKLCVESSFLVGFETSSEKTKNYVIENVQNNIFIKDYSSDYIMVTVTYKSITFADVTNCNLNKN